MASWMTGPDQRSPGKAARKLYRVWNKHIWLVLNSDPKKRTRLRNRVAIGMQDRHPNAQFQGPRIQCLVFLMFHPIPGKQTTPTYERDGHFEDLRSTSYMANLHHQLWPMIETYRSSLSFKHSKHYLEPCYDTSWGYSLNQKKPWEFEWFKNQTDKTRDKWLPEVDEDPDTISEWNKCLRACAKLLQ